jgi:glucose/arabinose dehydrogenase
MQPASGRVGTARSEYGFGNHEARWLLLIVGVALAAALGALLLVVGPATGAATLPAGFTQSQVVTGLESPTTMAFAPDPDGRIFVAEQAGKLRIVKDGALLSTPAVDLSGRIDATGERGLLGIAFDPLFSQNGYVYLYYTMKATASARTHNRVVRFTASGDRLLPATEKLILRLNNLSSRTNHNGGAIHFGEDGKLYVAVGENADQDNAQTFGNLLGKMLRINKDGTIPSDNPYFDNDRVVGKNKAIWARGLRNPYSFAVQPGTGRIHINDVGAQKWEEINRGARSANYGWPVHEGPEAEPAYVPPLYAYRHGTTNTTGCAITGGAFYNPQDVQFPAGYVGDYFFADFCGGWIRRYDSARDGTSAFATGLDRPVDLKVGRGGALFYLARGDGSVYRIQYTGR